jgi:uncharacterized protein YjbI with pentapeptide repeats
MPVDPKDTGELQKAINDAAGKASVLWTTFVTFELYLVIAFGSVKHRDLFLETPIKLPLLNVDLPLVGFFVVAPTVLVIFHFYVFLQLLALAAKAEDYDTLLRQAASDTSDRQLLRHRLDSFFVLQLLIGPRKQRTGFAGFSLRLIAWITLVGAPVLILLHGQVTFLPYHREWVIWLQRITVLMDLVVIWYFWKRVRGDNESILPRGLAKARPIVGVTASVCIFFLSVGIATFPNEWADEHVPYIRYIPTTWRPHWSDKDNWTSLHELLFAGDPDEVSGRARSLFSNYLVLTDQSFVDPHKPDEVKISHPFRGRDLRRAVLNRADLRKADFTGAMLNGASFEDAELEGAQFGCAQDWATRFDGGRWPDDGCTWLQGAFFLRAQLKGASFKQARLQAANLTMARLEGAFLSLARLQGATLTLARLRGADLSNAKLQGANLDRMELQGAWLIMVELQGASLPGVKLQGANLSYAQLQGANLDKTELQGALLTNARVWRAHGAPKIDLTDVDGIDLETKPWEQPNVRSGQRPDTFTFVLMTPRPSPYWEKRTEVKTEPASTFAGWRDGILAEIPDWVSYSQKENLSALDPAPASKPKDSINADFWKKASSARKETTLTSLTELACSADGAPHVARGLLRNVQNGMHFTRPEIDTVAVWLRKAKSDRAGCLGVEAFTDWDWRLLDGLVAALKDASTKEAK